MRQEEESLREIQRDRGEPSRAKRSLNGWMKGGQERKIRMEERVGRGKKGQEEAARERGKEAKRGVTIIISIILPYYLINPIGTHNKEP